MRINQVLLSASPGDAITSNAIALRSVLAPKYESSIFALHRHLEVFGDFKDLKAMPSGNQNDVLIFHVSIGDKKMMQFLEERPEKLVIIYHNITPIELVKEYDAELAESLERGRTELIALRDRVSLAIAVSEFNAEDLRSLGYNDVKVCPLIIDVDHLLQTPPDEPTSNHLNSNVDGNVFVFVGQILPHKRPEQLIETFNILSTYIDRDARLIIVGNPRLRRYARDLQRFVYELNLPRVWLTGRVTNNQLISFYQRANAFVTLSDHEGFCVPIVESMAFDVPVIAKSSTAIPSTVGNAGVLIQPNECDPFMVAEAMNEVATNKDLRESLHEKSTQRVAELDIAKTGQMFLNAVKAVV